MRKWLIIAISVLVVICTTLGVVVDHQVREKRRLEANQTALLDTVSFYKTESGKNAASVQRLQLSKKEIEEHCQDLQATVKDLGIKIKRLESASSTATRTEVQIKTVVKDTIIYRDTSMFKIKAIEWKDPWVVVAGQLDPQKDSVDLQVTSVDTLKQIVWRVPRCCGLGTKGIRQEIVSSNPHTKIVYTEYIELKRHKRKR